MGYEVVRKILPRFYDLCQEMRLRGMGSKNKLSTSVFSNARVPYFGLMCPGPHQ